MATTAADILVRAVMQSTSGLPADAVMNDFAFHWYGAGVPTDSDLTILGGHVSDFYREDTAGGNAVGEFIGESVNRSATHELQYYTIDTPLGSPRFTEPWLGPVAPLAADNNLPTEVAGVLSFHGNLTGVLEESGATRPRARRRGRIYVGPLIINATTASDYAPLLSTAFLSTMRQAAVRMASDATADGFDWSVWSRADDVLYGVFGGWTDDAPDTQRRRGSAASARVTYSV